MFNFIASLFNMLTRIVNTVDNCVQGMEEASKACPEIGKRIHQEYKIENSKKSEALGIDLSQL